MKRILNKYEILDDVTKIYLNGNYTILIDTKDYPLVKDVTWRIHNSRGVLYARGWNGKKLIFLHRILIGIPPKGYDIDHINQNSLDNRRENLRICTHAENCQNAKLSKINKSGYRGVSWNNTNKNWRVRLTARPTIEVGSFHTLIEAVNAYDAAIVKRRCEFGVTNKKLGLVVEEQNETCISEK